MLIKIYASIYVFFFLLSEPGQHRSYYFKCLYSSNEKKEVKIEKASIDRSMRIEDDDIEVRGEMGMS